MLATTLRAVMANLHLECVLISFSVNPCPFHGGRDMVESTCPQVAGWEPEGVVSHGELSIGTFCWQVHY